MGVPFEIAVVAIVLPLAAFACVLLTPVVIARSARRRRAQIREAVRLRRSESRFRSLVDRSSDVIFIIGVDSTIHFASPAIERVFGYAADSVLGTLMLDLVHEDDRAAASAYLAADAESRGEKLPTVWRVRHADGSWRHVESAAARLAADDEDEAIILNSRDITDRVMLEARLVHQAFHDGLTGLANRALFRDRVEHALARGVRRDSGVAVIFLDLDDFKTVNDSLGHAMGDRLLGSVAARLLNATRGCDTVARLGGDEFAVLLDNVHQLDDALIVVERIIGTFRAPFNLDGREVRVATSVGLALARDGDGAEEILRNADLAMYRAKREGNGEYAVFAPEMHTELLDRLELEADLRRAVEELDDTGGPFHLVYQPIVELETERVIGVEALVRWCHPERGTVPPIVFIPIAEQTGLIVPLGRWILARACREVASWGAVVPPSSGIPSPLNAEAPVVTVNLSGCQLQHPHLVDEVAEALAESGLEPRRLVLEITESIIMQDTKSVLATLNALRDLGVRLAIDDFGTGYSSLSYLQKFPVDILKIDKTFIDGVAEGGQGAALTRIIIALGDMLSLRMVAEGIEQSEQCVHLRTLGCGYGQGYLFAKPLSAAAAAELVRDGVPASHLCGPAGEVAEVPGSPALATDPSHSDPTDTHLESRGVPPASSTLAIPPDPSRRTPACHRATSKPVAPSADSVPPAGATIPSMPLPLLRSVFVAMNQSRKPRITAMKISATSPASRRAAGFAGGGASPVRAPSPLSSRALDAPLPALFEPLRAASAPLSGPVASLIETPPLPGPVRSPPAPGR